jgi:hypothetical protein
MAWLADRREWPELTSVFDDKVLVDYTSLNGGAPVTLTPAEIVAAWAASLGNFDATQHMMTSHLVNVDGDAAVCTANFQTVHRLANPHGSPLWTLGGIYRFELVRTSDGWKIRALKMTVLWADGNKDLMNMATR